MTLFSCVLHLKFLQHCSHFPSLKSDSYRHTEWGLHGVHSAETPTVGSQVAVITPSTFYLRLVNDTTSLPVIGKIEGGRVKRGRKLDLQVRHFIWIFFFLFLFFIKFNISFCWAWHGLLKTQSPLAVTHLQQGHI